MYVSISDNIISVTRSADKVDLRHGNNNHSRENQHSTSSGPPKLAEAKRQRHLRFGRSRRGIWINRTRYRYEIVIRGAQRKGEGNSISIKANLQDCQRNMNRVLHQLL
ncbi:hypothetical protein E2C01_055728 [Portunus trituberculatus]|uniref:Uncharacterized protein n=1 Tax=Portunus trituberculatus TaxID=210409 RepID=A0A5B7GYH3_PORTR|nr:hypothetical protein [Portunus trituberculatus]